MIIDYILNNNKQIYYINNKNQYLIFDDNIIEKALTSEFITDL